MLGLLLCCCIWRWSSRTITNKDGDQAEDRNAWPKHRLTGGQDDDDLVQRLLNRAFGAPAHDTRITPFYYDRGQASVDRDSLSLTTWLTMDRLHRIEALSNHHAGSMSVVVHITSDDTLQRVELETLDKYLTDKNGIRSNIDIHLVTSTYAVQHNAWRNLARFLARTDWILMVDADFDLCTDVAKSLRDFRNTGGMERQAKMEQGGIALVVPAFEWVPEVAANAEASCPKDKEELASLYSSLQIDAFEAGSRPLHWATDYPRFFNTTRTYLVSDPEWLYEPYVVFRKDISMVCDERFRGYGYDRAACISEMYLRDMDFYVLPDAYMMHVDHPRKPLTSELESENFIQWSTYRNDICTRVAQDLAADHRLHTRSGDRVRRLCSKIEKFGVDRYLPFLEKLSSAGA